LVVPSEPQLRNERHEPVVSTHAQADDEPIAAFAHHGDRAGDRCRGRVITVDDDLIEGEERQAGRYERYAVCPPGNGTSDLRRLAAIPLPEQSLPRQ